MADYRALAQALDPYAMDTGGITPDTIKALKTINKSPNLLGMIADIGRGGLSNLESLVRGGVAQVPGTAGDLETLGRMGINTSFGAGGVKVSPKAVMPTTSDILGMMPQRVTQARPETAGMEELGTVMGPGLAKGAMPVAKKYLSVLGNEVNAGLTGQPTRSIIGQITPKPLQMANISAYHGTSTDKIAYPETKLSDMVDRTHFPGWFTENPELANYYATARNEGNPTVLPVNLNIKKPLKLNFDMNDRADSAYEAVKKLGLDPEFYPELANKNWAHEVINTYTFKKAAQEAGFDAIQVMEDGYKTYAPLKESGKQIKSRFENEQ
jgi:hypothetical protein